MGMAEDAVSVLEELMQPGVPDAVRLKAVENVLSRSGIKDAVEVNVQHSTVSAVEELTKRLNVMRERQEEEPASIEEDIIDAEEVDEVESEDGEETADREDRDED
jgi:hypothetical protein